MKCPKCQFENPDGLKFCGNCGAKFATHAEPVVYEGARKQVTVFFADIKGSTSLTEKLDPEETQALLKPVLDAMFTAVHKFGGTILKAAGDGIMALFGAPIAFEDHALRACHAALLLQRLVKEMERPIPIRIGLNSGEVVVGIINADLRKEYDAMGPVIAVAARMEQTAEANAIQIAPNTYQLVKEIVHVHSRGKIPIKGISEPMEVFELLGVKQEFSRFVQLRTAHLSRFVGRKKEMDILNHSLDRALNGHGQAIGLSGEPGQGKSRLIYEFMNSPTVRDIPQYTCQSQTIFQNSPFYVIKQALKLVCGIEDLDVQTDQIRKIHELKIDLPNIKTIILDILSLPVDDPQWKGFSESYKKLQILKGIVNLFIKISESNPFILLVEDTQWIDNESLECLNQLIDSLSHSKILLLISFRPEFIPSWKQEYFTFIPVSALNTDDFYILATSILGDNPELNELKQQIVERCNGNPFFLEESIRSLKDRSMLEEKDGKYHLLQSIEHIVLPRTVQAVVDSRVDQLNMDQKNILKICAVIGKTIPINLLKYVVSDDDKNLDPILSVLKEKKFISTIQEFPEYIYAFDHDVILESIYSSILRKKKKELHLSVLDVLERKFPGENQEQIIMKADHAFKGEFWEKAFNYYGKLQMITHQMSAHIESLKHANKAKEAFHKINSPPKQFMYQYFNLLMHKVHLYVWEGKFSELISLMQEGNEIAKELNDLKCEAVINGFIGNVFYCSQGEYEKSLNYIEKGYELLKEAEKKSGQKIYDLRQMLMVGEISAIFYLGNFKRIIEVFNKNLKEIDHHGKDQTSGGPGEAVVHNYLLCSYNELGDFDSAKTIELRTLEVIKGQTPSVDLYINYSSIATAYCDKGEYQLAMKYINQCLEISFQTLIFLHNTELLNMKGYILSLQDKKEEAKQFLDQSLEISKKMNFTWKTCRGIKYLFEGYLNINEMETAKFVLNKMFELADTRKQKGIEVYAWVLKGDLDLAEDIAKPEKIEATLQKGSQLAEQRGMLPAAAHAYKSLSKLYTKIGQTDKAKNALMKAQEMDLSLSRNTKQ